MKKIRTTLKILLFLFIYGISTGFGHDEFTRVIKREFTVNPDAQLNIDNRFGKVHCNNWGNDQIQIEITISVEAGDQKTAEKIMDKISFDINGTSTIVNAKTIIEEGGFKGRNRVNIDYIVNMPTTINLDLTNKFGDIYINEISGKGKINLSYGNLEANKLGNSDNLLDIKFSKANVKWMQGAVLNLKYSEMDLDYAGSLRLDSKYSNLDANKIIALNVNFEGGKFNMENSTAVDSKSKFSDIEITRIEKSISLDIQYGSCDIHEMPADFSNISIKNKYGTVNIGVAEAANYSLDAELKFCELDFPEDNANVTQRIITNTTKSYRATVGKGSGTTSKIMIRSEFGNISLK
jgi:hypothetical protein